MRRTLGITLSLALAACSGPRVVAAERGGSSGAQAPRGDVVGPTTRDEIESALPSWRDAAASADVEEETARALAGVPPGAEVIVYLGTWCGDSRREVGRLFRALELVPEPRAFQLSLIGVDRAKRAPGYTEDANVRFVPTIVVRRDGAEVGRIVESAPRGVERELLDLLTGAHTGVISARTDL